MAKYVIKLNVNQYENIYREIKLLLSSFLTELYRYNNMIKNWNYYLKPIHIVVKKRSNGEIVKYIYYGRYWYRLARKSSGIKWIYIGREKPVRNLPDPPSNPVEGLVVKIAGDEVVVLTGSREIYELINSVLISS
ncbi:MAG: hypothetical protein QXX35_01310 [Desulfurococcaceae archaeon]